MNLTVEPGAKDLLARSSATSVPTDNPPPPSTSFSSSLLGTHQPGPSSGRRSYASVVKPSVTNSITTNIFRENNTRLDTKKLWHRTINSGSVIFDFVDTEAAYSNEQALKIIYDTYGQENVKGTQQVVNKPTAQEVLFTKQRSEELRAQAMTTGVVINTKQIIAQESYDLEARPTKIKLRRLPLFPEPQEIVTILQKNMARYGTVKSINLYELKIAGGKYHSFRGEGFVLLDTNPSAPGKTFAELSPFLHIPEWGTTIEAKWENAPPACSYCKRTGHYKDTCPFKKARTTEAKCYVCNQLGHFRYECPNAEAMENTQTTTTQATEQPDILSPIDVQEDDAEPKNHQKQQAEETPVISNTEQPISDSSIEIEETNVDEGSEVLVDPLGDYVPNEHESSSDDMSEADETDTDASISDTEMKDIMADIPDDYLPANSSSLDSIHATASMDMPPARKPITRSQTKAQGLLPEASQASSEASPAPLFPNRRIVRRKYLPGANAPSSTK